MDIKEIIADLVKKILSDKDFAKNFKKDPIAAVEELIGIDLPEEQIKLIASGVKEQVDLDLIGGLLDTDGDGKADLGGLSKLGGLFKK